jgi:hypothetical protein
VLVAELPVRGTKGRDITPDGTLKNILRLDYGYWESKDEALDLEEEIDKKIKKGYPLTNILFEDSNNAVLYQNSEEVMRIDRRKPDLYAFDRDALTFIEEFYNFRSIWKRNVCELSGHPQIYSFDQKPDSAQSHEYEII